MKTKSELRLWAKKARNELDMNSISEKILNIFLASSLYKNAINIGAYYPINTEIQLASIFKDSTKNFFLPCISESENKMNFVKYDGKTHKNKFNIPEPIGFPINPTQLDIIILPALMADINGYRLGYGKGYYDIFLNDNRIDATKIVLIPEKLLVQTLPTEEFDIAVNALITEKRMIEIPKL